jgi:hypothetical protein
MFLTFSGFLVRAAHEAAVAAAAAAAAPVAIKLLSLHTQTAVTRYLPCVSPRHQSTAAADNCHSDDSSSDGGSGISQWPSEQSLTGFDAALASYQLERLRCAAASSLGSSDDDSTAVRQRRQGRQQQRSTAQQPTARCDSLPPPPPPLEIDVAAAAEHCDAATQASPAASVELMSPVQQPAAAPTAVEAVPAAAAAVKAATVSVAVQCVSPQHKAVQATQCEARSQQTDPVKPAPTVVPTAAPPPPQAVAAPAKVLRSPWGSGRVHARVTGAQGMLDAPNGQQHTVWSVQKSAGRAVVMVQLQPADGTTYKQFLSVTDINSTAMAPIVQADTAAVLQHAIDEPTAVVQPAVTARSDRVAMAVRAADDGVNQWQREQLEPIWQVRLTFVSLKLLDTVYRSDIIIASVSVMQYIQTCIFTSASRLCMMRTAHLFVF